MPVPELPFFLAAFLAAVVLLLSRVGKLTALIGKKFSRRK
jgi:hypothetical protein